MLATDIFILSRPGVGTLKIPGDLIAPGVGGFVIEASGEALIPGVFYGVKTGLGAFSMTLPALVLVTSPAYIEIADLDNNAGVNNYTINAFAGDQIANHGALSAAYTVNISNTVTRLIANGTSWTAISYGQ